MMKRLTPSILFGNAMMTLGVGAALLGAAWLTDLPARGSVLLLGVDRSGVLAFCVAGDGGSAPGETLPPSPGILVRGHIEKKCYLGVTTSAVVGVLRDQLQLPPGMGLVVEYVDAGSPAGLAGIRVHDVLEKLEDQWVINGPQLAVLVRTHKAGDAVALTVLRGGKEVTLQVTLIEKDLPVLDDGSTLWPFWSAPDKLPAAGESVDGGQPENRGWQVGTSIKVSIDPTGAIHRMLTAATYRVELTTHPDGLCDIAIDDNQGHTLFSGPYNSDKDKEKVPAPYAADAKELGEHSVRLAIKRFNPATTGASLTRLDPDHEIVMRLSNGSREITVKDRHTNAVIYTGPLTNDALAKLPADIQKKVEEMIEKTGG